MTALPVGRFEAQRGDPACGFDPPSGMVRLDGVRDRRKLLSYRCDPSFLQSRPAPKQPDSMLRRRRQPSLPKGQSVPDLSRDRDRFEASDPHPANLTNHLDRVDLDLSASCLLHCRSQGPSGSDHAAKEAINAVGPQGRDGSGSSRRSL